jgi:hypothetical protein
VSYGIRITVDGEAVATELADANPAAATAIDELKVDWGRDSIYDQPDPAQATLTLLDRTGRYVDQSVLVGKRLEVFVTGEAAGDRRVFRGTITDPSCERITLDGDSAYEVTVVASDPQADLGRYIGPGDWSVGQPTDYGSVTLGSGSYVHGFGSQRLKNLLNTGDPTAPISDVPRILSGFDAPPTYPPGRQDQGGYALYVGAVEASGTVTALDLLRELARLQPLGWVNYDPAIDWLRIGQLANAAALRLALSGSTIVIVPAPPTDGSLGMLMLDASQIEVPDGLKLEAAPDNAIDRLTIPRLKQVYTQDGQPINGVQFYKQIMMRTLAWRNTTRFDPARFGVRSLDYGLTFGGFENAYGTPPINNGTDGVGWLADQVAAYINAYNGSYRLPRLRYRISRDPAVTDERTEMLINTRTHARPVFFSGSAFNGLGGVPSQVQIIGGTTGYSSGGWWADLTTAPANTADLAPSTLTLAQLVTNPGPTLADFDPSIRLADFGLITTGLN